MTTPAFVELENKEELIVELRDKFRAKYIDPESPKLAKFDERDVNRIFNDDLFALSFLNWKKGVMKDTLEMVTQVLEWRKENEMGEISVEKIGEDFIKRGICYIHGRGLDGKRIMCIIGRLQTKNDKEKVRKLLMLWLERLQRAEPGQHITFILDTHKTAMSNVDLGMIRFIIDSFSTYFPDLLERIIILDMPWIMNAIWKVVKQWMSEEQRSRVVFCSRQELGKFIAKDQLPTSMNGTSDWTFSFPPFPDDLSQKFDFHDDPMNFKMEKTEDESQLPNGSIDEETHSEQTNIAPIPSGRPKETNGEIPQSAMDDERTQADDEKPCTSSSISLPTTPVKATAASEPKSDIISRRQSSPKLDMKSRRESSRSPNRKGQTELRRRHTTDTMQKPTVTANVSFMSIAPDTGTGDGDGWVPGKVQKKMGDANSDEISLANLLIMSPVSLLVFKLDSGQHEAFIHIRNPNSSGVDAAKQVTVAFKIKTTSPEKYHVKPSVGILGPDESMKIRIYIEAGHEASMPQDRFLLLYKRFPAAEEAPSHSDIIKFWKQNSDKSSHFEHRLRVRLEGANELESQIRKASQAELMMPNGVAHSKRALTPQSSITGIFPEPESTGVVSSQLQQQIVLLNNKVVRLESDSRWIRRRLRHTMGLLFIVIILLLILLKEVLVLSGRVSQSMSL